MTVLFNFLPGLGTLGILLVGGLVGGGIGALIEHLVHKLLAPPVA